MARPLRLPFPGGVYHITARGNDRQAIFEDDADCSRFLIVLASVVARYRVRCHANCLMGNHYHLLLETPEGNLSSAMRQPEPADPELARRLAERRLAVAQCPEIPRAQRFASRPPLAELFTGFATRADRNARAVTAVRDHGYAMKEVADFLGRHYITVSRALAHADGLPSR